MWVSMHAQSISYYQDTHLQVCVEKLLKLALAVGVRPTSHWHLGDSIENKPPDRCITFPLSSNDITHVRENSVELLLHLL